MTTMYESGMWSTCKRREFHSTSFMRVVLFSCFRRRKCIRECCSVFGNDIKNIVIPKLEQARETKKESLKALFLCRQGYNRSVTYALALDCCLFRDSTEECWRRVSNIIICLRENRPVMAYYLTDWDGEGSRKWVSCPHFRALRALHKIIHSAV